MQGSVHISSVTTNKWYSNGRPAIGLAWLLDWSKTTSKQNCSSLPPPHLLTAETRVRLTGRVCGRCWFTVPTADGSSLEPSDSAAHGSEDK